MNRRQMISRTSGFVALGFVTRFSAIFGVGGVVPMLMKACSATVSTWTGGIVAALQAAIRILSPEAAYAALVTRLNSLITIAQDFQTAFQNGVPADIAAKFDLLSHTFETLANDLGVIKSIALRIGVESAIAGVSIFLHQIAGHIVTVVQATPGGPGKAKAATGADAAHVETIKRVAETEPWGKKFPH